MIKVELYVRLGRRGRIGLCGRLGLRLRGQRELLLEILRGCLHRGRYRMRWFHLYVESEQRGGAFGRIQNPPSPTARENLIIFLDRVFLFHHATKFSMGRHHRELRREDFVQTDRDVTIANIRTADSQRPLRRLDALIKFIRPDPSAAEA